MSHHRGFWQAGRTRCEDKEAGLAGLHMARAFRVDAAATAGIAR